MASGSIVFPATQDLATGPLISCKENKLWDKQHFFIKQNPSPNHTRIAKYGTWSNRKQANIKTSQYVRNITGTNSYWRKIRDELKAIIAHAGAPTFFFTFSSADMHWPQRKSAFTILLSSKTLKTPILPQTTIRESY